MSRRTSVGLVVLLASCGAAGQEQGAVIVRPGAPGEPSRVLDPDDAQPSVSAEVTPADVAFMQGMIAHHAQALTMSRLVPARAEGDGVRLLAERIERSQLDEIASMSRWLATHGEEVPTPELGYRLPSAAERPVMMPGMLTEAELRELEGASGAEFDRLFLIYMIRHHEGALTMVRELFENEGAGQESLIFEFAVEVDGDQRIEIARMVRMLSGNL